MSKTVLILVNHDIVIYNFRKELVEKLLFEGFEVIVSCPYGPSIDKLINMGVIHENLKIDRHGANPFKDLKIFSHYRKLIKKYAPNIVLTYTIKPNIYGGIASRLSKTPYLANITGLGTAVENKGLIQFITLSLYKIALKKANTIFFQNNENMEFMINKKIKGKSHTLLPGSGVNIEQFKYIDYPDDKEIHFLFIGRIMKAKGIDYYLKAAVKIKEKYPNTYFHIIGSYEEDYKNKIETYHSKGIIHYDGITDDVRIYLKMAHAIIHPTFHEGMSNVLLEAAASGRPIIASNVPGCIETFEEGVTGFGFESKNLENLVNTIDKFIQLPHESKKKMGIFGREKMTKEFSRDIIVDAYINKIETILEAD